MKRIEMFKKMIANLKYIYYNINISDYSSYGMDINLPLQMDHIWSRNTQFLAV